MMKTTRGTTAAANGGNGTPFGWSPLKFGSALKAWFDVSRLSGASADTLVDFSGRGLNLSAVGASVPITAGGLNSRNTLAFTGASSHAFRSVFGGWAQPMHVFMVCRLRTDGNFTIQDGGALNEFRVYDPGAGGFNQYAGAFGAALAFNNGWALLESYWNGANSFLRRARTTYNKANCGASGITGLTIGAAGNTTLYANMDLAEAFYVDATAYGTTGVNALMLYQAQSYVLSKWNV